MNRALILFLCFVSTGFSSLQPQTARDNTIVRLDPSLDSLVATDAKVEKLTERDSVFEGPTWVHNGHSSYLIFTDAPHNVVDKFMPDGKISVLLDHIFTGNSADAHAAPNGEFSMLGANGTTLDPQGRIVYCEFSAGQIVRLENDGKRTVLADRFEGKRLNAPNDLVYKSDGSLYFTDSWESYKYSDGEGIPHKGLYLLKSGKIQILNKNILHPNGLAFSPDEKYFYANDSGRKTILRFDVQPDDTIANGKLFIDMTADKAPGGPDGMKVDKNGDVYCTGPGGVWIISSAGTHLGTILTPRPITNLAFGDDDAKTLYMTAVPGALYRIPLKIAGIRP